MSRYYFLFVIYITLFVKSGLHGIGSDKSEYLKLSMLPQDTLKENQVLFNGRMWRNQYFKVMGDQFLFSNEFLPGSLTISGITFNYIDIRYDIYNDEIIIPTNHGSLIQVNKEMVDSFNIIFQNESYHFTKIQDDSLKGLKGYINILYNGKTPFFVKYKKEIQLLAVDGKFDMFYQKHRIYIVKDSLGYQVNSKRELFKHMDEYKIQVRSYIKKNRLNVSIKYPESIVPIIEYYDSLSE